ncbi:hypothetical protein [Microbispora sp. NBRC 16548]|nr:hypothetical protein [Microbispora sp. NBRC 16548]GLX07820.1 hypothetical protein Misp03_47460 [Microbispora sp. NBRC 16548]
MSGVLSTCPLSHVPAGDGAASPVATRYDKRAYIYLGTVTVAALVIWLRT